tara:strand:- start:5 stop:346 length:342 start_codon:yes stop_codon:yes gene_type:complete
MDALEAEAVLALSRLGHPLDQGTEDAAGEHGQGSSESGASDASAGAEAATASEPAQAGPAEVDEWTEAQEEAALEAALTMPNEEVAVQHIAAQLGQPAAVVRARLQSLLDAIA